jgi:putative flippase GtrA
MASIMAFTIGFYAIHLVFKYWIDVNTDHETPEQQMTRYMVIFVVNLAINTEIVYLLVTYMYVSVLNAQIVAATIVAYESYYAYRSLVFKTNQKRKTVAEELAKGRSAIVNDAVQADDLTKPSIPIQ